MSNCETCFGSGHKRIQKFKCSFSPFHPKAMENKISERKQQNKDNQYPNQTGALKIQENTL